MRKAEKIATIQAYQKAQWEKQQKAYSDAMDRYRLQQAANKALAYSALFLALIAIAMVAGLLSPSR
jgi:hypothetical protein